MRFLFSLLLPIGLHAQLALFTFDGTTETPVSQTYNFGAVSSGGTLDVRFHARNMGNSPVTITTLAVSGTGFAISSVNGNSSLPVAPSNYLEFTVRFTAGIVATYSANLQVNGIGALLLANSTPAAVLTVLPGCSSGSSTEVDFPSVTIGSTGACTFSLQNPGTQPITITTLAISGNPAFQFSGKVATPVTIAASSPMTFTIQFTPVCGTVNYSATLTVNGRSYALVGTGLTAPLGKPSIAFDSQKISSGEQHTIAVTLPAAAPCAVAGNLNLAFKGVTDDQSIFFLAGSTRSLPISIAANSTQVLINGQGSAAFQTGTTAGTLTFSLAGPQISSDASTSITIAPAPVVIETASASNQRAGEVDINIVGYDNTYSAGAMSFTFYDTSGKIIGSSISADFTSSFKTYYSSATLGSAFLMQLAFQVQGSQTQIGKVQATLTNSAGQTQTANLTFQ